MPDTTDTTGTRANDEDARPSAGRADVRHGAVAAGHPGTAAAARDVLSAGGNAFDAVLAAMAAATVVEPLLCSLGGGGFLMARPAGGAATLYDFFAETPGQVPDDPDALDFRAVDVDFGPATQEFHIGLGSMAVPGAVRGLCTAHRELATRPLAELMRPAVRLAREGVELRAFDAYAGRVLAPILTSSAELAAAFRRRDGGPLAPGDRLVQPELADTLERLGDEGDAPFHEGELAERLAAQCRAHGGLVDAEALGRYQVAKRAPLTRDYRGTEFITNPPPSSGGLLIAFALELLAAQEPLPAHGTPAHLGTLARAMALTNRARLEAGLHASEDAAAESAAAARLLDPALLARYRDELLNRPHASRGTTHISVVDGAGNVAAMTLSNGEGCGRTLPGTGIQLNNMLGEEDLHPQGFHRWTPATRIASMMAPSLLRLGDGGIAALGSGGSNRIRTALLQVASNVIDHGMTIAQAVEAPRLHVERGLVNAEPGYDDVAMAAAEAEGGQAKRWPEANMFFGGVHAVHRSAEGALSAAGDPRRGGVAATV